MKKIILVRNFFTILFPLFFLTTPLTNGEVLDEKTNNTLILNDFVRNSEYILGPGDNLYLRFFGESDFSGNVDILNDGTISVPILGDIFVRGLTKKKAEEKIEELIKDHLIVKDVQIKIEKTRNIKIAIIGEVTNPGVYSMTEDENSIVNLKEVPSQKSINLAGTPTLVDAIQKSGGLTKESDISNILIKRKAFTNKNNEFYIYTKSNLKKLLLEGDFNQNLFLFDGDVITIGKNLDKNSQSLVFGNLSPNEIDVYVVGEVKDPGLVRIGVNSSISKAILAAGGPVGFKANSKNIKIFSEDEKGNYKIKKVNFNLKNSFANGEYSTLNNGDVVVVGKKDIASTIEAINAITDPFRGFNWVADFLERL